MAPPNSEKPPKWLVKNGVSHSIGAPAQERLKRLEHKLFLKRRERSEKETNADSFKMTNSCALQASTHASKSSTISVTAISHPDEKASSTVVSTAFQARSDSDSTLRERGIKTPARRLLKKRHLEPNVEGLTSEEDLIPQAKSSRDAVMLRDKTSKKEITRNTSSTSRSMSKSLNPYVPKDQKYMGSNVYKELAKLDTNHPPAEKIATNSCKDLDEKKIDLIRKYKRPIRKVGSIPTNIIKLPSKKSTEALRATLPSLTLPKRNLAHSRLQSLQKSLQQNRRESKSPPSSSRKLAIENNAESDECRTSVLSEEEPMDWEEIALDIQPSGNSSTNNIVPNEALLTTINANIGRILNKNQTSIRSVDGEWSNDYFYFVLDTNVLICSLQFVDKLTTMKFCDTKGSILFIPYCVIQELDKLKIRSHSEATKKCACNAIRYINKRLESRATCIQAQSAMEECNNLITIRSEDDNIINCCLQLQSQVDHVLLLTGDINLRNKAISNGIQATQKSDLLCKSEETSGDTKSD